MIPRKRKAYIKSTYAIVSRFPTTAQIQAAIGAGGIVSLGFANRIEFKWDQSDIENDLPKDTYLDVGKIKVQPSGTEYWLRLYLLSGAKLFNVEWWDSAKTISRWATGTGAQADWTGFAYSWFFAGGDGDDLWGFSDEPDGCQDYQEAANPLLIQLDTFDQIDFAGTDLNSNHIAEMKFEDCFAFGCVSPFCP